MPTFADQWNMNPPPNIVLSQHPKVITVSGSDEEEEEISLHVPELEDEEMVDAEQAAVLDINAVRRHWAKYNIRDSERERQWGEAMDIDYEVSNSADLDQGRTNQYGDGGQAELGDDRYGMIVIDTNVLISHLSLLQDFAKILNVNSRSTGLEIVIPGIVIQELDSQSKGSHKPGLQDDARKATYWLLDELRRRKSGNSAVLRVQRDHETRIGGDSWKTLRIMNDDLILDACQFFSEINRTCLMTDDRNLTLKAESHGIKCIAGKNLTNMVNLMHELVPKLDVRQLLLSSGVLLHPRPSRRNPKRGPPPPPGPTPPYTPERPQMIVPPRTDDMNDMMDIDYNVSSPVIETPIFHGSSAPYSSYNAAPLSSFPQSTTAYSHPHRVPVPLAATNGPQTIDSQLSYLKSSFLDYLAPHLPAEVIMLVQNQTHASQTSSGIPDTKSLTQTSDIYASIHAPRARSDHARRKPRVEQPRSSVPSEAAWRSWSPQECIIELRKLQPLRPFEIEIDWQCLLSFVARQGQRGCRPDAGGRGDWLRAIQMLRVIANAFSLASLSDTPLGYLESAMNEIMDKPSS